MEDYKKVSVAIQAYWHAPTSSGTHQVAPLRVLTYIGAAAAAAALAFFLLRPNPRLLVEPAVQPAPATSSVVAVPDAKPTSPAPHIKPVRVRHSAESPQSLQTNWPSVDSAVQIAIPAESLLPPGAVPQGLAFVADLTIAPDGSPQGLHLEPQLIQFERSR